MSSGIYLLRFNGTDRVYIGQSKNLNSRKLDHFRNLKKGTSTKKLQEAYLKYGMPTFEVIIEVPEDELDSCENEAITLWDSVTNGFNTLLNAGDAPTEGLPGDTHWNSKYSNDEIILVFEYLVANLSKPLKLVSEELNVSYYVVKDIAGGLKHTWLQKYDPTNYNILMNNIGKRSYGVSAEHLGIKYPPLLSPDGKIMYVTNLNKFAREHNLNSGGLYKVLTGASTTCKGFKLYQHKPA